MATQKRVWVNLDPQKVDLTVLETRCKQAGWPYTARAVGTDREQSVRQAQTADAIISVAEVWDKETLPHIAGAGKILVRYGAGLDNIDVSEAGRVGIPVANLPGMNAPAVAEIALLHILNLGRRFSYSVAGVKAGRWPAAMPGNELDGKVLGLIGFGNIARQLVRITQGFDRKVLAYDAYLSDEGRQAARRSGVVLAETPDEVYAAADILSLHVPLNSTTRNLIDESVFSIMKPTAYLVNTCRGGVVNEAHLIKALETGEIRGAGLDVMTEEPPLKNHLFFGMENVFVTSHLGALAQESENRSQALIADIVDEWFEGRLHPNVVNPKAVGGRPGNPDKSS